MNGRLDDQGKRRIARITGLLYLAIAVIAPFSMLYVPSRMLVPGDGAASMAHVLDREALFRAGMVVDALVVLVEIGLSVLLYRLLESVHPTMAAMAAFARLAMTVIQGVNLGLSLVALRLAENRQPSLVLVFLLGHGDLVLVWQAFFGLHCALLGVLVHRSGSFPRVLGALLVLSAAGYLSDSFGRIASRDYGDRFGSIVAPLALMGELSFTLWLIFKGIGARAASAGGDRTALHQEC